jgi:hypothetical protein
MNSDWFIISAWNKAGGLTIRTKKWIYEYLGATPPFIKRLKYFESKKWFGIGWQMLSKLELISKNGVK